MSHNEKCSNLPSVMCRMEEFLWPLKEKIIERSNDKNINLLHLYYYNNLFNKNV